MNGKYVDGGEAVPLAHTVVDGNPVGNNCFLDLMYCATNGPYGNPCVYSKTSVILKQLDFPKKYNGN